MNIFLVRHGKYQPNPTGENEGLTEEGKREVALLRDYFAQNEIVFDKVLTSPKTRTIETASILNSEFEKHDFLTPNADPDTAFEMIPKKGNILVVSHLPLLEKLSEKFGERISFEPASMAQFSEEGLIKVLSPS